MLSRKFALGLLSLVIVGCGVSGPGDDGDVEGEPPDEIYDPDDGEATVAEYAPRVNFDRHRVLEDDELTDWDALTVAEVQDFLQNNPYGWTSVLANHTTGGKSAAQAIIDAATLHQINPIVILTRVQLEQSLIGKSSASQNALNWAMGCGCPDNQPCNPAYKGFGKQIKCMASLFRSYLDDLEGGGSTIAGWRVGQGKTTLDNYTVTPVNAATASIYTYTPWVSSAKNHRKIWELYTSHVGYTGPDNSTSSSGAGGSGGSGGSDGSGGMGGDPGPVGNEVCYPGQNQDGMACVPTVDDNGLGSGYNYPSHSSLSYQAPVRFIDLTAVDSSLKLAPNFALNELMQEWKGRYAIFQPHVVEKLQTIRNQIGGALNINSGYRNVSYNSNVGGATYSRHMYGDAADMASGAASLNTLKSICTSLGADYIGMYSNHIHCDWRYASNDPAFFGPQAQAMAQGLPSELPLHDGVLSWRDGAFYAQATGFDEGEPLREWIARDVFGEIIDHAFGETFEPPAGTDRVTVEVGGQIVLETTL